MPWDETGIIERVKIAGDVAPRAIPPLILLACLGGDESEAIDSAIRDDERFSDYPRVREQLRDSNDDLLTDGLTPSLQGLGNDYAKHFRSFLAQRALPGHRRSERGRRERVVGSLLRSGRYPTKEVASRAGVSEGALRDLSLGRGAALSDEDLRSVLVSILRMAGGVETGPSGSRQERKTPPPQQGAWGMRG